MKIKGKKANEIVKLLKSASNISIEYWIHNGSDSENNHYFRKMDGRLTHVEDGESISHCNTTQGYNIRPCTAIEFNSALIDTIRKLI